MGTLIDLNGFDKKEGLVERLQVLSNEQCKFNCSCNEKTITFHGEKEFPFFEVVEISKDGKVKTENIRHIIDWISNYGFNPHLSLTKKQIFELANKVDSSEDLKDKLYAIEKLLTFAEARQLRGLLEEIVVPKLSKIIPKGRLYFVKTSHVIINRVSLIRILFGLEYTPEILELDQKSFRGIQTLIHLESASELAYADVVNPFFGCFPPFITGISIETVGGIFVVLFDNPVDYSQKFPRNICDLIKDESLYFGEVNPRTLEKVKNIEKIDWGILTTENFFKEYIQGLNQLFQYVLDPCNFSREDNHQKKLDTKRMYLSLLTLKRISREILLIESEYYREFIRKNMFFDVVDQLSGILESNLGRSQSTIFKAILRKKSIVNISAILQKYSKPIEKYLSSRCTKAIFDTHETIEQGVYIPSTRKGAKVIIQNEEMRLEEYVTSFLREIRNTHHGYDLSKYKFVVLHNGNISDKLSLIAVYVWLAMVKDPAFVLEGRFIEWSSD